jgi:quercetin dioxygenase-like cupin family protein
MIPSSSPILQVPPPDPLRTAESQESLSPLPWPQASDPQIRVTHHLAEGDPPEEVLRLSQALRCDLIVMGTHGRTGLARLLTGSIAEAVLRNAVCPVLVVRTAPVTPAAAATETTARSGELIDVRPLGPALGSAHTRTLLRTETLHLLRLIIKAGHEISQHKSNGEIIVHCLEGRIDFRALGKTQVLEAGMLVELPAGEPHSLTGIEDAAVLLTIALPRH